MARTVSIGAQGFENIRSNGYFYIDKTSFVRDWWLSGDDVTLVCRPRRFGKTLTLDTVRCFLSQEFGGRGQELFGGLDVWEGGTEAQRASMRALQGTVPVVALSFAGCKGPTLGESLASMRRVLRSAVREHDYLRESRRINGDDLAFLASVSDNMPADVAADCLGQLCSMLYRHHGVAPVVLLDEYDTPLQEAWLSGYWDGMSAFVRQLFNATFKTNAALGRALVTGVTRVASESILSDMNNPAVVTTTTPAYEGAMGFTEREVARELEEFGMVDRLGDVRAWYDGFTFGDVGGIYNPWSITCYLASGRLSAYWANSSSNALASDLVQRGGPRLKEDFEDLLAGGSVVRGVDESIHFRRLGRAPDAVWSLLLATGYLRVSGHDEQWEELRLSITNEEVRRCFYGMVGDWFDGAGESYGEFCRALLADDVDAVNHYLSEVVHACMSSFDAGVRPSEQSAPERFYHGLTLGLLVDLRGRYSVESNRESGFGRYDVALVPKGAGMGTDPAIVIEFKVFDARKGERTLEDTVASAHAQIADKGYVAGLVERGVPRGHIRTYGFAFRGKDVLVG